MLLQQRHKEVDGEMHILCQLIRSHIHMAYSHRQTQHLKEHKY